MTLLMRRALVVGCAMASALNPTGRRRFVGGSIAAAVLEQASPASASSKVGLLNIDGVAGNPLLTVEMSQRPAIPKFVRQNLDQDFAVCLMRNSYNVVDALDFVAMDEFQKRFFLLRQDEWEPYQEKARKLVGRPPAQGELTDPLYFDFISFAQYKAINEFLRRPKSAFDELVSADGETVVVLRNGTSVADPLLASEHAARVGGAALDFVLERFATLPDSTRVVVRGDQSVRDLAANVNKLCVLVAVLGFCADASADLDARGNLKCTFVAPSNFWGLKSLTGTTAFSRQPLLNDFAAKIVTAYLARCGRRPAAPPATEFLPAAYSHTFALAG